MERDFIKTQSQESKVDRDFIKTQSQQHSLSSSWLLSPPVSLTPPALPMAWEGIQLKGLTQSKSWEVFPPWLQSEHQSTGK